MIAQALGDDWHERARTQRAQAQRERLRRTLPPANDDGPEDGDDDIGPLLERIADALETIAAKLPTETPRPTSTAGGRTKPATTSAVEGYR